MIGEPHSNTGRYFARVSYATLDEVKVLFGHARLVLSGQDYQSGSNARPAEMAAFLDLLGATYSTNFRRDLRAFTATTCSQLSDPQCPQSTGGDQRYIFAGVGLDRQNRAYADLVSGYELQDHFKVGVGHFLISETNPSKIAR